MATRRFSTLNSFISSNPKYTPALMICERGGEFLCLSCNSLCSENLDLWRQFFPPFRYSNIIGNPVATNEAQTCWLGLRGLLNRPSEILPSKAAVKECRRSIRYAD